MTDILTTNPPFDTDALSEELNRSRQSLKRLYVSIEALTASHQEQVQKKFLKERSTITRFLQTIQDNILDLLEEMREFSVLDTDTSGILGELTLIQNQIYTHIDEGCDALINVLQAKLSELANLRLLINNK